MRLTKDKMKALAAMISQFIKDNGAADDVILLLVNDLVEENDGYSGVMSYMSTVSPLAAAHVLRAQSEKILAGQRGELVMVSTSRPKDEAGPAN